MHPPNERERGGYDGASGGVLHPFPAHVGPGPWPKHDAANAGSAGASGPLHHHHGTHGALNNNHHPVHFNPLQQHPPHLILNHNHNHNHNHHPIRMEPRRGSHGHGRTSPAIAASSEQHSQHPQRTQYARAMNHHNRPVPLALLPNRTPASPRWDSIDARSRNVSPVPPSPFQPNHNHHITSQRPRAESTTPTGTPRLTPRSVFPGLSSHPFIPEALEPEDSDQDVRDIEQQQQQDYQDPEPSPSRPSIRKFPLIGRGSQQIDDEVMRHSPIPLTPTSPTHSYTSSIVHSRQATTDTVMVVENFSRPRKTSTSIRSKNSDISVIRAAPPIRHQHEPSFDSLHHHTNNHPTQYNENIAPNQLWPQDRRFSTASSHSSSTFSSSIAKRPSNDQLQNAARDQPPVMRRPFPAPPAGVSGLPARPAPPVSYNNYNNFYPPATRDPPAWIQEEFRPPSFRSPFATNSGERCSILTTHSITEQSIINGYARASWRTNSIADDGPSIEDVMVMYERGFNDSEIENLGFRKSRRFLDDTDHFDPDLGVFPMGETSRPATSHSDPDTDRTTKIFEAMQDEPLPLPGARPISRKSARQSNLNLRKSGLMNSLPKDIGLAISEDMERKRQQSITEYMEKQRQESVSEEVTERRRQESDAKDPAKHDSAKLMDGDNVIDLQAQEPAAADTPTPTAPMESMESMEPMDTPELDAQEEEEDEEEEERYRVILTPIPTANMPVEPPEEPGSRDRYGFRKANSNVTRQQYDDWDAQYSEYLARRRRKWIAFLKDNSLMTDRPNRFPPRSTKTKRFIRKGIPPDWRGAAWFYYAGGPALLSKHRGVYDDLVRRAGLDPKGPGKLEGVRGEVKPLVCEDIEKDLHRTFPDNVRFKPPQSTTPGGDSQAAGGYIPGVTQPAERADEPEIISSLRRVLHAFALYNPRIGYCQSLNFLAGLLLLFVETEEQAFWLLNVITRVYLPGTHEMSLEGSKVDLGVLMGTLKDSLPNVWKQIGGDELEGNPSKRHRLGNRVRHGGKNLSISDPNRLPAITLCMTAWFMSCFIGTLPIETVLRVWDVFFYEGSRTLFRIALTIFKLGENEIRAVQDPMEMFGVVQAFPRRLIDCNMLMDACYKRRNGIGHLTQEAVEEKRAERRENIQKWRALQEAASEAGPRLNTAAHSANPASRSQAAGLDLAADDRKGTLFGRRRDREQARADEVM
ncbi:hypothetical protein SMACR_01080 [Sordaria macrospora]|uniref:WGS project CABT00000000 data, contig 2.2 n=2 Tax=Sordaria macrospora TaxID=5147 RepID=F7VNX7_SORMK|nr:uncharacterized protein SMAC_01080 [Sordaria macrospora k-hell]KAA8629347.1 hypothetical protein SMACR_01080 [Sordaria macrospora]WPJ62321.1 hypothetical protein SMAC4_01080 [Sordaria macrospora]CCC07056.1 unnamed protein product [Sordaria macrospora k-hell]